MIVAPGRSVPRRTAAEVALGTAMLKPLGRPVGTGIASDDALMP